MNYNKKRNPADAAFINKMNAERDTWGKNGKPENPLNRLRAVTTDGTTVFDKKITRANVRKSILSAVETLKSSGGGLLTITRIVALLTLSLPLRAQLIAEAGIGVNTRQQAVAHLAIGHRFSMVSARYFQMQMLNNNNIDDYSTASIVGAQMGYEYGKAQAFAGAGYILRNIEHPEYNAPAAIFSVSFGRSVKAGLNYALSLKNNKSVNYLSIMLVFSNNF